LFKLLQKKEFRKINAWRIQKTKRLKNI